MTSREFANQPLRLTIPSDKDVVLRSINEDDLENLREWKNENRSSFFFQEPISRQMQKQWFKEYVTRPQDFMFVVEYQNRPIGCMAFRKLDQAADIYNVINGSPYLRGKGHFSKAFHRMLIYIAKEITESISLKVLSKNPAVKWYEKQGFEIVNQESNYINMKYLMRNISAVEKE